MKRKPAFTLTESLIVIIIIGIIYVVMLNVVRPNNVKKEVLIKSGFNLYSQIDFATKHILAKRTNNYTFLRLKDESGTEYSIASSDASTKLIKTYKKFMSGMRNKTPSSSYTGSALIDSSNTKAGTLKVSSFASGFTLKNGAYFAIKLNGNCTTTEQYIYSPVVTAKRIQTNSCGLIFYDVNGETGPNTLGVDQYIISIGKYGIK